jgi:hypothetical protein
MTDSPLPLLKRTLAVWTLEHQSACVGLSGSGTGELQDMIRCLEQAASKPEAISDPCRVNLPKWPALVVVGDPVTKEQAQEICVRTDSWGLSTNDYDFIREVGEAFGLRVGEWNLNWDDMDKWRNRLDVLDLAYLHNQQIVSAWVGGPHGWCDWNGVIGCRNYNIGKWPCVEDVFQDWTQIAKAFPFLRLTSQLYDGESGEDGIKPVVEFVMANGRVTVQSPVADLNAPIDSEWRPLLDVRLERGITIEGLREAVNVVLVKRGESPLKADSDSDEAALPTFFFLDYSTRNRTS